jgi:hypothetical protein
MASLQPVIRGALAGHPAAEALAREVWRVHHRYAVEVVGAFRLCPHMKDAERDFGHFFLMLDWEPDLEATFSAFQKADSAVIHLVFPCIDVPHPKFEAFAGRFREAFNTRVPKPPVMAVFHPDLPGDFSTSHRLVGLVRRAPDPFIQLIPEGMHEGGTVFIESIESLTKNVTEQLFSRLKPADHARIIASIEDIRRDRTRSYAPLLDALRRG